MGLKRASRGRQMALGLTSVSKGRQVAKGGQARTGEDRSAWAGLEGARVIGDNRLVKEEQGNAGGHGLDKGGRRRKATIS